MTISFPKKLTMLALLLTSTIYMATVYAQATSGNIIKKISLQSEQNRSYLVVRGLLDPVSLSKMGLKKSDKKVTVILPNTIVDSDSIPNPLLAFDAEEPVESIKIVEKRQETDAGVTYALELEIQGRTALTPYKIEPVTTSTLRFLLKQEPKKKESKKGSLRSSAERMGVSKVVRQYRKPSMLQISILNASGYSRRAYKLSVFLGKIKKKQIEEELGIKLDIVNIANAKSDRYPQSTIYFKDNFLKSALYLAELIPGEQKIVPLKNQKEKIGIDMEIYLGKDYK